MKLDNDDRGGFDWFGTLAQSEHEEASNYSTVLRDLGYEPDTAIFDAYYASWDGVDHRRHSMSRETYLAWTRDRLRALTSVCGISPEQEDGVITALIELGDGAPMVPFPDALGVLQELRSRGISVGICSNWGWDLQPFLEATAVAQFLDAAVTSAQAGFRKPHPGLYELMLRELSVDAKVAVFVGDSWGPDVLGPLSVGMTAVHIARGSSTARPDLVDGASRIRTLDELLVLPVISGEPSV